MVLLQLLVLDDHGEVEGAHGALLVRGAPVLVQQVRVSGGAGGARAGKELGEVLAGAVMR